VLVLSYGVRGTAGFGSVVAMPLLALVVPMKILVPVWTLMGIASSLTVLGRDRREIAVRETLRLLPGCIIGIGIGLYFFTALDTDSLARGLGIVIVIYGLYSLWASGRPRTAPPLPPGLVAPLAGALGGAAGATFGTMASLFFAAYLDALRLSKVQFRATMSALLLTLGIVRGAGYYAVGEFGLEAFVLFAAGAPLMLLGMFLGDRIHTRISEDLFRRIVSVVLIVSGLALILR
jgi:uncharacterized protein